MRASVLPRHSKQMFDDDDSLKKKQKRWSRGCFGRGLLVDIFILILIISVYFWVSESNSKYVDVDINNQSNAMVSAIVYIVMGDLAAGPAASIAVESLRVRGEWVGPIVVLTDHPECLTHLNDEKDSHQQVTLVHVRDLPEKEADPAAWLLAVKAVKTRLFELIVDIPGSSEWNHLLYLDSDVWVTRPLASFLYDLPPLPSSASVLSTNWVALFADCNAHAVGWCSGCDAWNTGVMILSKGELADQCLVEWRNKLLTSEFPTDQEALEHVAQDNKCSGVSVISHPMKHLLFLKDYLAIPFSLIRWPTFIHVTAANRISTQDSFYRMMAAWVHSSLHLDSPFADNGPPSNTEKCEEKM